MAKLVDKFYKDAQANVFNFSYSVLAILLIITVGITYAFYQSSRNKDITRFQNATDNIQSAIENKVNIYIGLLNGGRGFIESAPDLTNDRFIAYAKSLNLERNYTGLRTIGFIKTVKLDQEDDLVNKMKFEGYPEFNISTDSQKDTRHILIYVYPLDDAAKKAVGFDMGAEEVRYNALERAAATGDAAASGKVIPRISPESSVEPRILILLPVYGTDILTGEGTPGSGRIQGYVYSSFIADNFIQQINRELNNRDISIKVYDEKLAPDRLLTETGVQPEYGFISLPSESYKYTSAVEIAGRNWIVEYGSLSSFSSQSSLGLTPLIFLSGVSVSFLLFGMTYWEASARAKLQQTAAELFETQKQKEKLFEEEQKSRLAAEQASGAKDEFIAIVSHELKTPLNAIAGWSRILRTHDISETTRETALVKIDKNLRAQAELVEQLLTYSDIVSESIDLNNAKVNFSELAEESITEVTHLANEKGIELITNNDLNGEVIAGDTDRLKMVFDCILNNAVKFTQQGGKIEAGLCKEGDMIRFTVKDNGRGIPIEFMPFIFDQYKQADTPNTRDYGGLGLGLTITKHIVKLHGGTIDAESEGRGKGSKFILEFPEKKAGEEMN